MCCQLAALIRIHGEELIVTYLVNEISAFNRNCSTVMLSAADKASFGEPV
jgi:hypothetical protein